MPKSAQFGSVQFSESRLERWLVKASDDRRQHEGNESTTQTRQPTRRSVHLGIRHLGPNKKPPRFIAEGGGINWQRPTFAGPVAQLSSAQQRFTSVFGMGTGGATALGSPEL